MEFEIRILHQAHLGSQNANCGKISWVFHYFPVILLPSSSRIVNRVGVRKALETHRKFNRIDAIGNTDVEVHFGVDVNASDYDGVYSLLTHEAETSSGDAFLYSLTVVLMLEILCEKGKRWKIASLDSGQEVSLFFSLSKFCAGDYF